MNENEHGWINMDFVPNVTREDVIRVIGREFPNDCKEVAALLDRAHPERVQLAILKLSRGSIDEVRRYVEIAQEDFRDVIAPAEYPRFWAMGMFEAAQLRFDDREQLQREDYRDYQAWLTK